MSTLNQTLRGSLVPRRFPGRCTAEIGQGFPSATIWLAFMSLKLLSIAGFVVTLAALVFLMSGDSLIGESPLPIGMQILALCLMVWARATFGRRSFHAAGNPTGGGVVSSGPYKYVRHPIYASVLYIIWVGVLSHLSILNVVLGTCAVAGSALRMFAEEKLVVERYPEYKDYAGRTKAIIPFVI